MPRVTAAIVSFDTRELLLACLEPLVGDPRVETWVVDNGSTDGSVEAVRLRHPGVRVEVRADNPGFGAAVNLVARTSRTWDWLLLANADTALGPGALDALLEAGDADRGAGALAPRLVRADGSTQHSVFPFWSPGFALRFNAGWHRLRPDWGDAACLEGHWDPDRARRVPWAVAACLLVRRAAWEQSGGFDPAQWLYAEDLDLGWRLAAAGWGTRYVPTASVLHAESASTGAVWGDARAERWMAASYDWMLRRRGRLRTAAVAATNVVGALARGAAAPPHRRDAERRWARLHARGLRPRAVRAALPRPPGAARDVSAAGHPATGSAGERRMDLVTPPDAPTALPTSRP